MLAVIVEFDIDTKQYTLEWEEENNDTQREKDWTGRTIGNHLHSKELEKYSVGECVRKKFNGEWFDGKIQSINVDTKFYHIKYNDGDEEDMMLAEVKKWWVDKDAKKKAKKK